MMIGFLIRKCPSGGWTLREYNLRDLISEVINTGDVPDAAFSTFGEILHYLPDRVANDEAVRGDR